MKSKVFLGRVLFPCLLLLFASCSRKTEEGPKVTILSYASLSGKGGFLNEIRESFRAETGCALKVESTLGAAQMISLLREPKMRDQLDLVMGVDEVLAERLKAEWIEIDPPEWSELKVRERLIPLLQDRLRPGFLPLDYGALTFVFKKKTFSGPAGEIDVPSLGGPLFRKKFILQDPRASSPGLLFFLFASGKISISDLRKQWLTLAPSWDSSYKIFLAGDAPLVWTYLSSLAYHASKNELSDYGFIRFKEGLPVQVEGVGVLKRKPGLPSNPCVSKWYPFLLKPSTLALLASKQWMWPAFKGVDLPPYFDRVPLVEKAARVSMSLEAVDHLLSGFGRDVQGDHP